jgi:hypothetical protein
MKLNFKDAVEVFVDNGICRQASLPDKHTGKFATTV